MTIYFNEDKRNSFYFFSLSQLYHGHAAHGALESQCAHIQIQETRTKLWLFDTIVIPTLL